MLVWHNNTSAMLLQSVYFAQTHVPLKSQKYIAQVKYYSINVNEHNVNIPSAIHIKIINIQI